MRSTTAHGQAEALPLPDAEELDLTNAHLSTLDDVALPETLTV